MIPHRIRTSLPFVALLITLLSSCVEPPQPYDRQDIPDASTDMPPVTTDMSPDQTQDLNQSDTFTIIIGDAEQTPLSFPQNLISPLPIQVLDTSGSAVDEDGNPYPFTVTVTDALYDKVDQTITPLKTGTLSITVTTNAGGSMLTKTREFQAVEDDPRFTIPRIIRLPKHDEAEFAFDDFLQVQQYPAPFMSLSQWQARRYQPVDISLTPSEGTTIALTDAIDNNIGSRNYTLSINIPGRDQQTHPIIVETINPNTLSSGKHHRCQSTYSDSQTTLCFGENTHGQLGNNTTQDSLSPTPVTLVQTEADYLFEPHTSHEHVCALSNELDIYCWGSNSHGQSSNTSDSNQPTHILTPTKITPPTTILYPDSYELASYQNTHFRWAQVTTGRAHSCGLSIRGTVYCWGDSSLGQLGWTQSWVIDKSADTEFPPIQTPATRQYKQISAGADHTCGITTQNLLFCWGSNRHKQINASNNASTIPTKINLPDDTNTTFERVWTGPYNTCAKTLPDGDIFCWGDNTYGQIRPGTAPLDGDTTLIKPTLLNVPHDALTHLSLGKTHSCSISAKPDVTTFKYVTRCWGSSLSGALGQDPTPGDTTEAGIIPVSGFYNGADPLPNFALDDTALISVNDESTCTFSTEGSTPGSRTCWGAQTKGQLGDNNNALVSPSNATPTQIEGYTFADENDLKKIRPSLSELNTCIPVLDPDAENKLKPVCWGASIFGQGGMNTPQTIQTYDNSQPINQRYARANYKSSHLVAAHHKQCTIKENADVFCWGLDPSTPEIHQKPVKLFDPAEASNIIHLATSKDVTCVWTDQPQNDSATIATCFGDSRLGALGADIADEETFHAIKANDIVEAVDVTLTDLQLGERTGCLLAQVADEQQLWCWGDVNARLGLTGDEFGLRKVWSQNSSSDLHIFHNLQVGDDFACMIAEDNGLYCIGTPPLATSALHTENETTPPFTTPTRILQNMPVRQLSIRNNTACALLSGSASIVCFGDNTYGQAGAFAGAMPEPHMIDNLYINGDSPLTVPTKLAEIYSVNVGEKHTCITGKTTINQQSNTLTLQCWGLDTHTQTSIVSENALLTGHITHTPRVD